MQRQQAATVWTEALRFIGLLRAFLARFFSSTPSTLVHPAVNSLAASQERIQFVTSADRLPPAPSFSNGQLEQPPAARCADELPCRGEKTGGGTGAMEATGTGAVAMNGAETQAKRGTDRTSPGLASTLESLLFVADEPVDAAHLAQAVRASQDEVRAALAQLRSDYETHDREIGRASCRERV